MEAMRDRVLVVEDEKDVRDMLRLNLKAGGFDVLEAHNGAEGLAIAKAELPSVVILDLMMPEMSGMEVCRALRRNPATSRIPILMLTAKSTEVDKVAGLEVGADDYVTKPFSPRELLLRVRAVARRQPDQGVAKPTPIRAGSIGLDRATMTASIGSKKLPLTSTEFRLLDLLIRRAGTIQSREALLSEVWGYQANLDTRTVDTHVRRLRDKLGKAGGMIVTVRGSGYRLGEASA
ncbi:MAG: DNA-binding response regulator [Verrucomicrobia bacterium]|jgi:two-component system phosphate regulon response regulator PhoB|nr:DNA-binding response regulator [Verrucomicrobiota bacterium]NBS86954.1 DNA-binding response regulator [Verrucomicrobiota bacterium]